MHSRTKTLGTPKSKIYYTLQYTEVPSYGRKNINWKSKTPIPVIQTLKLKMHSSRPFEHCNLVKEKPIRHSTLF